MSSTQVAALVAVLGTAVVYGTDVFCAIVLRPALARVDDQTLGMVIGFVHRYADRRMPLPGAVGIAGAAVTVALAALTGSWGRVVFAGIAVVLLVAHLLLYARVSAPINRELITAAENSQTLPHVRQLQASWERIITARAVLQGFALAALCVVLAV